MVLIQDLAVGDRASWLAHVLEEAGESSLTWSTRAAGRGGQIRVMHTGKSQIGRETFEDAAPDSDG